MFPANPYWIWLAGADDAEALSRLEEQASAPPLAGRVLMGQIQGTAAAAVSLEDGRVLADPAQDTGPLVAALRMRAAEFLLFDAPTHRNQWIVSRRIAA